MQRHSSLSLALFLTAFAVAAVAVDLTGDEKTNRRLVESWKATDPDHVERLRQNLQTFKALPQWKQDQLRQLEKSIAEQDAAEQTRLRNTMERYVNWLARLDDDDRHKIDAAPAGADRLKIVNELLDRQWMEGLSRPDRERLAKSNPEERAKLLEQLHKDDDDRRKMRVAAHRMLEEAAALGPGPFGSVEFKERLQQFADEGLRPLLNSSEELRLNRPAARNWAMPAYFAIVHELAVKQLSADNPPGHLALPFPGPAPAGRKKAVRSVRDLPQEIVKQLPSPPPKAIADAEGKWPQLPLAVADYLHSHNIAFTENALGPTRPDELPPAARRFLIDELLPKISEVDRRRLDETMGRWPDFPKKVKELAEKTKLPVPGLALPGNEEVWQRILKNTRANRQAGPSG